MTQYQVPPAGRIAEEMADAEGCATSSSVTGVRESELHESLTSTVLLTSDVAIKWKRPVSLDFVDFTNVHARRVSCEREVRLNRRLAADVYLGVGVIVWPHSGPPEPFVAMRRLPASRSIRALADAGTLTAGDLESVARVLAEFHAAADRGPLVDVGGMPETTLDRWEKNAAAIRHAAPEELRALSDDVLTRARVYVTTRAQLFRDRVATGRICDGHGDLLTDDVYVLADGPRVLDCLDFDDALRYGDVLADVAFLAMDLEFRGHEEMAAQFVRAYRRCSADPWPESLLHHYIAYRAQVRAKVAQLRERQLYGSRVSEEARALLALARSHLQSAVPMLVLVGGLPGSGKSTLADAIAPVLDARVLRTDDIRDVIVGPTPLPRRPRFETWPYRPQDRDATYAALIDEARAELAAGRSVILDATFTSERWRSEARRVAEEQNAAFGALRCSAPIALLERRLTERAPGASDATPEVARALAERDEPWADAATVDTSLPWDRVVQVARVELSAQLGTRRLSA